MKDVVIIGHSGKSSVFPAFSIFTEYSLLTEVSIPAKEHRSRLQENIMIIIKKIEVNEPPIVEKERSPKHAMRASAVTSNIRTQSMKSSAVRPHSIVKQRVRRLPRNKN